MRGNDATISFHRLRDHDELELSKELASFVTIALV